MTAEDSESGREEQEEKEESTIDAKFVGPGVNHQLLQGAFLVGASCSSNNDFLFTLRTYSRSAVHRHTETRS